MKDRSIQPEKIERVVVRGANWVGDAVMTVPALRKLRELLPGAHITLATRPWAAGLFEDADFIDDIMTFDDRAKSPAAFFRQVREWRRRRFDLALLFPNAFAPALVAAAARVPRRVGYATDGRGPLLTTAWPVPEWRGRQHEVFYYIRLVWALGLTVSGRHDVLKGKPVIDLPVSAARLAAARELLRASGVEEGRPVVAVCPGSTNSRAKRWPAERFAAVADLLSEREGAQVLLVGAAEERDVSAEVERLMRRRPLVLTGRTSLAETAAVLAASDLLVTNDTGPAHVAAAVGCPVVVVFGPTNPQTTRPYAERAEVVRLPPDCAPCMLRDCPIDHRCMTAVTPEEVYERSRAHLSRAGKVEVAR